LLELPRELSPAQLAGGFGLPEVLPAPDRIEDSFLRRIEQLPEPTRMLLVVAAADPTGDAVLVWRAAGQLALGPEAAGAAESAGLLEIGAQVRFRHPLVRSAVYRAASRDDRQRAHRTLAQAIDPLADPDRRAWHRAQAAADPDEDVAAELERSAGRAQARGGLAAAAAFLERSAELTVDPARRADRLLAAAQAKYLAGAPEAARALLAAAEAGPPDALLRARMGLLRGQMAFGSGNSADASALLLTTAQRLERLDPELARETYLDALAAGIFVGRLAGEAGLPEIARAARAAPAAPQPRAPDLLLDGLAILITDGYEAGTPVAQRAVSAFRGPGLAVEDAMRWSFVATHTAHDLWDDEGWEALSTRHLQLARDVGALGLLPIAIAQRVGMHLHAGEFAAAAALVEETEAITEATGADLPPYSALALAAWQGHEDEATRLIRATLNRVTARGEGMGLSLTLYTSAVLHNGLGRYRDAFDAAKQASAYPQELGFANFALVELVEAAARSGEDAHAAPGTGRGRGHRAQAGRGTTRRAHRSGGADRPAGPGRLQQLRDRRRAVHQPAHGRVAPAQGVHQARHQLPARTPGRAARPHRAGPAGLTGRATESGGRVARSMAPRPLWQTADVTGSAQHAPFGQKILVSSQNVAAVPVP
jgi:hypothetical protein